MWRKIEICLPKENTTSMVQFSDTVYVGLKFCCDSLSLLPGPQLNRRTSFARAALKPQDINLYQCQAWAKFTGEADYTQPLHRDFANHTLTVSSENPANNSEAILCYFSDVGEAHGPMHYVTRSDSQAIAGPEAAFSTDPALQQNSCPYAGLAPHLLAVSSRTVLIFIIAAPI